MLRRVAAGLAWLVLMGACADAASVTSTTTTTTTTTTTATTTTTSVPESTSTSEFLSTTSTTEPFRPTVFCVEEPPPPYGRDEAPYEFDPGFYAHYCSASGIFIVGSQKAPIEALEAAAQIVDRMFSHNPQLVASIVRSNYAVILTGIGENAGDLPEWQYEEVRTFAPDPDHPGFASSGGGLSYTVSPADDVLCEVPPEKHDSYGTPNWGSVLIHELGHMVEETAGLSGLDALFEVGSNSGAWHPRHYAMTNPREYWAEVVQVYLGQYEGKVRGRYQPRTRAELRENDPAAFAVAAGIFERSTLVHYWCDMYRGPVIDLPAADVGAEAE